MNTLFDKIWDAHVVAQVAGGSDVLYIDRQYIHEVTSPPGVRGFAPPRDESVPSGAGDRFAGP